MTEINRSNPQPLLPDEAIDALREAVQAKDINTFLERYKELRPRLMTTRDARFANLVPRLFEPMVLAQLRSGAVSDTTLVRLWSAAREFCPVLVNEELLEYIDERIDAALQVSNSTHQVPAAKLSQAAQLASSRAASHHDLRQSTKGDLKVSSDKVPAIVQLRRTIRITQYSLMGDFRDTDARSAARTLLRSPQELAFLKAVRAFFPQCHPQVNVPLSNFIDADFLGYAKDSEIRRFLRFSMVDLLLCTCELDPIAGFEIDSSYHDTADQQEADRKKDLVFRDACIPLFHIRDDDPSTVTEEDFYDVLAADERVHALRRRRMRVGRDTISRLVPL